jgi:hypothetical protein
VRVTEELRDLMAELGIRRVADAIATLEPQPPEPAHAREMPR